jgi:hypothetical protein
LLWILGFDVFHSLRYQVLVLTNLTELDSGWYSCAASNEQGDTFESGLLTVEPDDGIGKLQEEEERVSRQLVFLQQGREDRAL